MKWSNLSMDPKLNPLSQVLERVDSRLLDPEAAVHLWTTGFPVLDQELGGGLRAGSLNLLAGAQGEGKTTFALQIARANAKAGRPVVFFSFELEGETLLTKIVSAEAAEASTSSLPLSIYQVRAAFEGTDGLSGGLPERLGQYNGGLAALETVSSYADNLVIHRSTTTHTSMDVITGVVKDVYAEVGEPPIVVVDYLQKVNTPDQLDEEARVTYVTERLKDLAIEFDCPVLAISASDKAGLEPGTRMRARNLRGSTALAYEADVVLILSNKANVVARHHLMFAANNGDDFRHWSVVTIEKNRSGQTGGEIEFRKHFECGRFLADGHKVTEKLVDERVYVE